MIARRLACLTLFSLQLFSSANGDNFSWNFQRTGFRSTLGNAPQTALSMRGNLSWPVVYGLDQGMLNAYSLFPVLNPGQVPIGPATNWHQIGSNLTRTFLPGGAMYLQADSGAPDGFAVSLQSTSTQTPSTEAVVIGNSISGFQAPLVGMQAVKFRDDGTPFTASTATIPGLQPSQQKLFDVALSDTGDVGAVTQFPSGSKSVTYWQQSPLLGGAWLKSPLVIDPRNEQTLFGPSIDLTFDSASRPHILGINRLTTNNSIAAYRFDTTTSLWASSILDTAATIGAPPIADVAAAANEDGILGAAWVNNGVVKYAYMDTNEPSPNWVVTTVAATTPLGTQIEFSQGVGLAYDNAGLPVISFVDRGNRQIWIAYDPPLLTAPSDPLAGDFNGDGFVDASDLNSWTIGIGAGSSTGDADDDGDSDGADFLVWQRTLGDVGATVAPVPETGSLTLFLLAATVAFSTSRRREACKCF
jgi:hypothetical protein